ncbi:MAG: ATP-binding cassette domain-containing protein [Actinomycetia bacterium]|nr:ATP-binding cassette domain-containing protein [Actinomycetes bacterium]
MTARVRVQGLKVHFGGVRALDGVDLDVEAGSLVGVVGPNGSGKTTLINALTGLVRPTAGSVSVDGVRAGASAQRLARAGVRRTFQTIRLLPDEDLLTNVAVGADSGRGLADGLWRPLRAVRSNRRSLATAAEALERVGLLDLAKERPAGLPYGHQRKVELARALAGSPRVLLLDEPVAGMTGDERRQVGDLLLSLTSDGLTQVLVEHDLKVVSRVCTHLAAFDHGVLLEEGDPGDVLKSATVKESYLGVRHTSA